MGPYMGFYSLIFDRKESPTETHLALGFHFGVEFIKPFTARYVSPPNVEFSFSLKDEDGNGVLSQEEKGEIIVRVSNVGNSKVFKNRLRIEVPDEIRNFIHIDGEKEIGRIDKGSSEEVSFSVRAEKEIPSGEWNMRLSYSGKNEADEWRDVNTTFSLRTSPLAAMIKVGFRGLTPRGLPNFIVPTPPERADYLVSYSNSNLSIANLNTGEIFERGNVDANSALRIVRDFFNRFDREEPSILLSTSGGTIGAGRVIIRVRYSDDAKVTKGVVYLNGEKFKEEHFTERSDVVKEYEIPLIMGDNSVRFVVYDWVGKSKEKEIKFFRIRGMEEVQNLTSGLAYTPPPSIRMSISTMDGDNIIRGGSREGLIITLTNEGKGPAKLVSLEVKGSEVLRNVWGELKKIGTINPGESKSVRYEGDVPSAIPKSDEKIYILLYEGSYEGPLKRETLSLRTIPEDVDRDIPETSYFAPHRFALIIGISEYQHAPELRYARRDAEAFRNYAEMVLGIPRENIKILLDSGASYASIKREMEWLKEKRGEKFIYFTGHGTIESEKESYLLPWDGDPSSKDTLISQKDIPLIVKSYDEDKIVLLIDACFSGAKALVPAIRPPSTVSIFSSKTQPSYEFEDAQHGYFTYFLLLGLKGKADKDRNAEITAQELADYVKENVEKTAGKKQIPYGDVREDIILTKGVRR